MCNAAGITLLFPQTRLRMIWSIKPREYVTLLAYAPWSGIGFLLLSALMVIVAWGVAQRKYWAWQLAIAIFVANGVGDALLMLHNRVFEGAIGVVVTGGVLCWLMRRKIIAVRLVAKPSNVKSRAKSPTTDAHERAKDFLDEAEIERLLAAARTGRHGVRDHLLLLMIYRHGLRVLEAIGLRWDHVNLERSRLWVERLKGSLSVEHSHCR